MLLYFLSYVQSFDLLRDELIRDETGELSKMQEWTLSQERNFVLTKANFKTHLMHETEIAEKHPNLQIYPDYHQSILKHRFYFDNWLNPSENSYRKVLNSQADSPTLLLNTDNVANLPISKTLTKWNGDNEKTFSETHTGSVKIKSIEEQLDQMLVYSSQKSFHNLTCPLSGRHLSEDDICNGVLGQSLKVF